jgi:NADH dehydrogenase FAD-containing subunit
VFVIGDLAAAQSEGKPVPGVSPAAKQMGRVAARNIKHHIAGQPAESFVYKDYGSLACIGRRAAIAMVGKLKFSGIRPAVLAVRARVFPDRLPQPHHGDGRLGLGVFHLQAQCA